MALSDSEFRTHSDNTLEKLNRAMDTIAENYDAEVLYQNGVLTVEIEDPNPGKIVISPNSPARQIWISAQSTSFKLDWSGSEFVWKETGENLTALIGRLVGEELGVGKILL